MTFKNWKVVEEFLLSRPIIVSRPTIEEEGGRTIVDTTKEEVEEVLGQELKFNDELKIEDPDLITLMWTKTVADPDGNSSDIINYDHRVNRDGEEKPVRITVYLN